MKTNHHTLTFALALAALALDVFPVQPARAASWGTNGPLTTARYAHTAVLLPNGKVLAVGGVESNWTTLSSTELFDPATGTWMPAGAMTTARGYGLTATVLPNGTVLVAGGMTGTFTFTNLSSAEAVRSRCGQMDADPRDDPWTRLPHRDAAAQWEGIGRRGLWQSLHGRVVRSGNRDLDGDRPLTTPRADHTAILLSNGKVLVAGGVDSNDRPLSSAELYDPTTGTWTSTRSLNTARDSHTATLLPNGKVLVVGGTDSNDNPLSSAELYDPTAGTWTTTGALNTARDRSYGLLAAQWDGAGHRGP